MSSISSVESYVVPYTEPNDHGSTRYVCLVRVVDSDGLVGWGEAAVLFKAAALAVDALIREWSASLQDAAASPAEIFETLRRDVWWYGDAGIACFARAAIDMALWDIAGKRKGLPLAAMLGQSQPELPVLISCHATRADLREMSSELAGRVRQANAIGIKVGFGKRGDARLGYELGRDREFVKELRGALGPNAKIMIDIGAAITWSLEDALARVDAFIDEGVDWLEEPLGARHPDYAALHQALKSRVGAARLAFGEREWSPQGYSEIISGGAVEVVGIDPGRALGVTGFVETTRLIEARGIQGNAHAFTGPVIFAASLALSLASRSFKQLELMPLRNTLYDLAETYPEPRSGKVRASELPGLGVDLSLERVKAAALA